MRGIASGGVRGPAGPAGVNGVGVPVGGTTGQVLAKSSNTDFDSGWVDASSLAPSPVTVTKKTFQQKTVLYDNTLNATGVFDVSSLAQDYDHLEVMLAGRSTANGDFWVNITINGDADQNNYLASSEWYGSTSGGGNSWSRGIGYVAANDSPASQFPVTAIKVHEYTKTDRHKTIHYKSNDERLSTQGYVSEGATIWRSLNAVNRLAFAPQTGQFAVGSRLQIVGVKVESVVTDVQNAGAEVSSGWIAADVLTYASADDPTYTVTCVGDQTSKYSPGMRIKLTQATGGTKFFIITAVAVATNTILTLYGGTDFDLVNEAISNPFYSMLKAPAGFPLNPTKWTVEVRNTTVSSTASPAAMVWGNYGNISITIPIGVWQVWYSVVVQAYSASASQMEFRATLSTANNSESDPDFSTLGNSQNVIVHDATLSRQKTISLSVKTLYYLNERPQLGGLNSFTLRNDTVPAIIRAVCAYL